MHFDQWIRWGSLFRQSMQSQSSESGRRARASKMRTTPKHDGKIEPVLTALETREMIGTFVADVALAAGVAAVAERARDPLGEPAWVDLSVYGGSSSGPSPSVINRGGWPGPVPPMDFLDGVRPREPAGGRDDGLLGDSAASPTISPPTSYDNGDEALSPVLTDALYDFVPPTHGAIRKLQLAPPASAVGASTTFVADTRTPASRGGSDIEMPSLDQSVPVNVTMPTAPPILPPVQPLSNGGQSGSSVSTVPASQSPDASGTRSAEVRSSEPGSFAGAPTYSGEPAGVSLASRITWEKEDSYVRKHTRNLSLESCG